MRKFKRRRQGTGFAVLASLVIVALGGLLYFGMDPAGRNGDDLRVQRLDSPQAMEPPKVVAQVDAAEEEVKETAQAPEELKKEEPKEEESKEEAKDELKKEEPKEESKPQEPKEPETPTPSTNDLYLTVPKMGLYDNYVANGVDDATLYNGAGKTPESAYPWDGNANPYIASHVLGYSGTGSYMHFAALQSMTYGDEIILSDINGTSYTYQVTEILTVGITENWVTAPIPGKDMVSLQTCINPPAYDLRYVVRGERVAVSGA
jgi:sortase A